MPKTPVYLNPIDNRSHKRLFDKRSHKRFSKKMKQCFYYQLVIRRSNRL